MVILSAVGKKVGKFEGQHSSKCIISVPWDKDQS